MIFIIGGSYQGKTEYAEKNFNNGYRIIDSYHLKVREQLESGLNPLEEVKKLISELRAKENGIDRLVIISNELGCGIVPIDRFEREYREQSGRVNCYLAEQSEEVIRVMCGIGMRIK